MDISVHRLFVQLKFLHRTFVSELIVHWTMFKMNIVSSRSRSKQEWSLMICRKNLSNLSNKSTKHTRLSSRTSHKTFFHYLRHPVVLLFCLFSYGYEANLIYTDTMYISNIWRTMGRYQAPSDKVEQHYNIQQPHNKVHNNAIKTN